MEDSDSLPSALTLHIHVPPARIRYAQEHIWSDPKITITRGFAPRSKAELAKGLADELARQGHDAAWLSETSSVSEQSVRHILATGTGNPSDVIAVAAALGLPLTRIFK